MATLQDWILSISPRNLSGMLLDDGAWKKVRAVEQDGDAEVWDIQVDEDSSFTAEGCIVHNCPLQLEITRRMILLYSNPGEIVFSPFAGIGSEGYVAVGGRSPKTGRAIADPRRFYGCELKPEYHAVACANLTRATQQVVSPERSLADLIQ